MAKGSRPGKRSRPNISGIARFANVFDGQPNGDNRGVNGQPVFVGADEEEENLEAGPSTPMKSTSPPSSSSKKQRMGVLPSIHAKYDALHLVTRYESVSDVPEHLQKYFSQRLRFFSLYERGCLLDEEGWFSVTPEKIAIQIAERCRCDTVLDAFCGVGGNAIALASTCHRVIAIDISRKRLEIARHNAIIYGVADRIEFIHADFFQFARTYTQRTTARKIDVVFLSPPWGGPNYMDHSNGNDDEQSGYSLRNITPVPGDELFRIARRITHNIAYFLPRNVELNEVSDLLKLRGDDDDSIGLDGEKVEVEEEYMSGKLKAVTCYFGGLASGQEDLF